MRRLATRFLFLFVAAFALACTDAPTAATPELTPGEELTLTQASSDIFWTRGCPTTIGPIQLLATVLFLSADRADRTWIAERLVGLSTDVRARRQQAIQDRANAIVDWLLARQRAGKFRGTDAQLAALINAIYCFAGIEISTPTTVNTELILPSDQPQTVITTDLQAGVQLDANPVTEPTLLTVTQVPADEATDGLLDTKLDQYRGFIRITVQSAGNSALAKPVTVGVCATGSIPAAVRNRLRLGHGKESGFEIAAPGNADFLQCANQVADAGPAPLWKRLASSLLPTQLHAFQDDAFGGGVGGTVTEFSPFAPVDPQLEFGGGVGGTVTEFIRVPAPGVPMPTKKGAPMNRPSIVADPCLTGHAGAPLPAECVPSVRITTRLGTELTNVPVLWDVIAGGGSIAPKSTVCGSFGPSASTLTNALGRAGICWTLGALGSNKVLATPTAGGDAPEGVEFVPTQSEFEVTATSGVPSSMEIVQGGGIQWGVPAGTVPPIAPIVRVTDSQGYPVAGVPIAWGNYNSGEKLSTFDPRVSVTGQDGTATTIWTIGQGDAHIFAFFYVSASGIASTSWSEGAQKYLVVFEATPH